MSSHKEISQQYPLVTPDNVQAAYWTGPLTRKEAQQVFDEYGKALLEQGAQVMAINASISYLMEKFGVKPQDVADYITAKAAEQKENSQKQAEAQPSAIISTE